jgi:molecular chaperone DnaK
VPGVGLTFEDVVHVLVPTASLEVMGREIESAEGRVADVRRRAFRSSLPEAMEGLNGAARLLAEARAGIVAARGGDADAAQRVHRLLLDLNGALDAAEVALGWPELEERADSRIRLALYWVSTMGTSSEQALCEQALAAASEARQRRNGPELDRQISVLSSLANAACARDPRWPAWSLDHFAAHLAEATDARRAQSLLDKGRKALARDDTAGVRAAVAELEDLFPGTPEERRRSFGSGLR